MRNSLFTLALTAFAVAWTLPAAATMRCGQDLVDVGDTTAELLMACGEPLLRQAIGIHKTETSETIVEQWTYNFGSGTLLQIVSLEAGVITGFEDGARQ